jgi:DNA repair protein RecO (recombination protein O)
MFDKLKGIVLNVIKYNDRSNIAHIYTDKRGIMSFIVPCGNTPASRMRNAMFMPLSLIEFEANIAPGREIANLNDIHRTYPLGSIYKDPVKSAITMFISELLSHTIQEHEQNKGLFQFITTAIQILELSDDGIANFHLCFLYHLGAFIGIQPDIDSYKEGYWFDMDNGVFTQNMPVSPNRLAPNEAHVIKVLSLMDLYNLRHFKFNHDERNQMLDTILTYYRIHNSTIGTLKSPDILKQLFVDI